MFLHIDGRGAFKGEVTPLLHVGVTEWFIEE